MDFMSTIYNSIDIEKRINYLENLKNRKRKSLEQAPEGTLFVAKHGNRTQYYNRFPGFHEKGTYLSKNKGDLIKRLAQKDYDMKVLRAAENELQFLEKQKKNASKLLIKGVAEDVYTHLSKERQFLVKPIMLPDDQLIEQWQNQSFERKGFRDHFPEYYTEKGERVRSKSEILIANTLMSMNIPYHFELPLVFKNGNLIHPDFTILHVKKRKTIYLEHLGMMDDVGYNEDTISRLNDYEENNIILGDRLFLTYETRKSPLNIRILKKKLRLWLEL